MFRDVLTSLAGRQRLSNDELEIIFEQVDAQLATLPKHQRLWRPSRPPPR